MKMYVKCIKCAKLIFIGPYTTVIKGFICGACKENKMPKYRYRVSYVVEVTADTEQDAFTTVQDMTLADDPIAGIKYVTDTFEVESISNA